MFHSKSLCLKMLFLISAWISSCFLSSQIKAQIFDDEDLSKQLQEQGIQDVHLILGGIGQFFFPILEDRFRDLVRSRLPSSGAQPVIVTQPALYLNLDESRQVLSHNSLLHFLKEEKGQRYDPNFRLLTFAKTSHLDQIEDFEGINFFELSDRVLFPQFTELNVAASYEKSKGIEEILADPSLDQYIKFLQRNKFKRIHITIFEGDQKSIQLLIKLLAYLKQMGAQEFERVSVAFYLSGAGAASTYLMSFPNIHKEIPWIEFLVADYQSEHFVSLNDQSMETFLPMILEQSSSVCNFYANSILKKDSANLTEDKLGKFRFSVESLKDRAKQNLGPLFFSHGSFITFRRVVGSLGDVYKISFGDRFDRSFRMKLFLKMNDSSQDGGKPVLLNAYADPYIEAKQVIVPKLSTDKFSLILKTRFGDVEFPFEEILKNFEETSNEFWVLGVFRHLPMTFKDVFHMNMNEELYMYIDSILDSEYPELRPLVDSLKQKIPSFLELLLRGTNDPKTIFRTAGFKLSPQKGSCGQVFGGDKAINSSSDEYQQRMDSFVKFRQKLRGYATLLESQTRLRILDHNHH